MAFCGKCGANIGDNASCEKCDAKKEKRKFCGKCGKIIVGDACPCTTSNQNENDNDCSSTTKSQTNSSVYEKNSAVAVEEKIDTTKKLTVKKLNKKSIIGISLVAVLVAIYLGVANYLSNPMRTVNSFKEAVTKGDSAALINLLENSSEGETEQKLVKEDAIPTIEYYKSKPQAFDTLIKNLTNSATTFKNGKFDKNIKYIEEDKFFLMKTSDTLGIKKYKIAFTPQYININSEMEGATISVNKKDCGKIEEGKLSVGPLLPASYEVSGKYSGTFELADTKTINFMDENYVSNELSLFEDAYHIDIYSNNPNYKLFVNGKEFKAITEGTTSIGPLSGDVEIYGVVTEGDTELKTRPETVDKYTGSVSLKFESMDDLKKNFEDTLDNLVLSYVESFASAVNSNNFDYISEYLEPGSTIYTKQRDVIKSIYDQGIREKFLSAEVKSYIFDKKTNIGEVEVSELYDITYEDDSIKTKSFINKYKFKYNHEKGEMLLTELIEK